MEIKDIIRKRREELNLTYEQLGNMVGVGKSTVRKWETGMIENMRRDNIVSLAKALNISPAVIMGWEDIQQEKENEINNNLSQKEKALLKSFSKLNDLGKDKVIVYTKDLLDNNKYSLANDEISATLTEESIPYLVACHDDNLSDEEKAIMDQKINKFLNKQK
ncbi:Cro/Cl family transcriptional regulator [Clostridium sporogenes]